MKTRVPAGNAHLGHAYIRARENIDTPRLCAEVRNSSYAIHTCELRGDWSTMGQRDGFLFAPARFDFDSLVLGAWIIVGDFHGFVRCFCFDAWNIVGGIFCSNDACFVVHVLKLRFPSIRVFSSMCYYCILFAVLLGYKCDGNIRNNYDNRV